MEQSRSCGHKQWTEALATANRRMTHGGVETVARIAGQR
jgi:hypothetical protein